MHAGRGFLSSTFQSRKLNISKYFTNSSLFLKDLAKNLAKSLSLKDRDPGGLCPLMPYESRTHEVLTTGIKVQMIAPTFSIFIHQNSTMHSTSMAYGIYFGWLNRCTNYCEPDTDGQVPWGQL